MEWQLVPYAIPLFVGAMLLIFTAFFALSRGSTLAAIFLAISNILLAVYVVGYAMELGQNTEYGVLFWARIGDLGLATAPGAWFDQPRNHRAHRRLRSDPPVPRQGREPSRDPGGPHRLRRRQA